ncbi:MAG: hypothetical protein Q9218_000471 [Villophora microphyllina]
MYLSYSGGIETTTISRTFKQASGPTKRCRITTRKLPEVTGHESSEKSSAPGNNTDRQRLATEVINAVLKALTEAVKSQQHCRAKQQDRSLGSHSNSSSPNKESRLQTALQPISVNTIVSERKHPRSALQSRCSDASEGPSGLLAQAECARLALAALRASNANKSPGNRLPFLQIENAMSTLISKCIALGLLDPALRELRILKKLLLAASGEAVEVSFVPYSNSACKENVTDLLVFPSSGFTGPLLAITVTFQLQIINVVAAKRDTACFRAMIEHLSLRTPYSPAKLIEAQHDPSDPQAPRRIASQLESLARTISSMCPSTSSSEDHRSESPRSMDPLTSLRFQLLALDVRLMWWDIAEHKADFHGDLLQPLSRYLCAFRRRCSTDIEDGYRVIKEFLSNLTSKSQISTHNPSRLAACNESWRRIYSELVEITRESPLEKETCIWIEEYVKLPSDATTSPCRKAIRMCEVAVVRAQVLGDPSAEDEKVKALENAEQSIEGDLDGASEELDELLLAVSRLRKTASSIINKTRARAANPKPQPGPVLVRRCFSICITSVRFLNRYIGRKPPQGSKNGMAHRYQQRVRQALAVATAFIESVISIAKLSKGGTSDHWLRTEVGLGECLGLMIAIEGDCDAAVEKDDTVGGVSSLFLSISNVFWSRYVQLKQTDIHSEEKLKALNGSLNAIAHRPLLERLAAQLHIRLEHFARSLESARDYKKAAEGYMRAIKMHVEADILRKAAVAATSKPLAVVFARDSEFASLGRVLAAYPRLSTRDESTENPEDIVFDDERLEPLQRGIALELQLASLISLPQSNTNGLRIIAAIRYLAARLFKVYPEQFSPIYRLRVAETLSWLQLTRPGILSSNVMEEVHCWKESSVSDELHGLEPGLQLIRPHLDASRYAVMAIREPCSILKRQRLKSALAIWYPLLEQCDDLPAVEARVGDACVWLQHLELLARYLEVYGLDQQLLSVLHLCSSAREKFFRTQHEALALTFAQLGLQHLRNGYLDQAGMVFQKAQKYVSDAEPTAKTAVTCHVAYARYFFATSNIGKCVEKLAHAQQIFQDCGKDGQHVFVSDRIVSLQIVADVAALCSDLAGRRGDHYGALLSAHQGLKLAQQAWTTIDKRQKKDKSNLVDIHEEEELSVLADSISKITITESGSSGKESESQGRASVFWCLVPQLHRAFLQVAHLYADGGMFKEAKYYIERSLKLAGGASASGLLIDSLHCLANLQTRSNDHIGANNNFGLAQRYLGSWDKDLRFVAFQIHLANYHLAKEETLAAEEAHRVIDTTLQDLSAEKLIDDILHRRSDVRALQEQISDLSISKVASHLPSNKKKVPVKRSTISRAVQTGKGVKATLESSSDHGSASAMVRLRCAASQQRATLAVRQGKLKHASELLAGAENQSYTTQETVFDSILRAEISIKRGLNAISVDPIFCVLPESTVSLPAVLTARASQSLDVTDVPDMIIGKKAVKRSTVVVKGRKTQVTPQTSGDVLCDGFRQAQTDTSKVMQLTKSVCPTSSLHHLSKIMAESLIRLSALSLSFPQPGLKPDPNLLLHVTDAARGVCAQRGKIGVLVEKGQVKEQELLTWPAKNVQDSGKSSLIEKVPGSASDQEQYLSAIPTTWQIISISLSQSCGDILVSRIRSGQAPFVLSLPLDRHSSREASNESFGFRQAKVELEEILGLADYSTHDTPDASRKGARAEWWERRAALDARLKDLLTNISSVWFGGFQGIFSQRTASPELLARFQQSLDVALDNHLPSRRCSGRKRKPQQTSLDPRIVELFVALGDPADLSDMEEPLMDLLYFVTDILQFHGERNAYDEIDFDSMAVAIIDALRQYHQAAKGFDNWSLIQHTVLVLDKELHRFPWESLPCLDGQAITRLPSLSCLHDRMPQAHEREHAGAAKWRCTVDRRKGAFVLNPSSDLQATQTRFEEPLRKLEGWEGLTGSEPGEAQLKGYLQEQDIFLYFGHGSGGQYIRSKTVQKLDRCAVALLIGCSSGRLTEVGEFEPYGTPMNYMQAGSTAMLATLWDVTDKDIDRFSETVLQKWGLFEDQASSNGSPVKKAPRTKGKGKARTTPRSESAGVSLDQAVVQGRGSCIFRYLNGAAPVVYGIPVFLAD